VRGSGGASAPAVADAELSVGFGVAAACFAGTFRGPRASFWRRMTGTAMLLGGLALWRQRDLRRLSFRAGHVLQGASVAAGLYLVFQAGDRVARRIVPSGADDISAIYGLRSEQNRWLIATQLGTVIAPAEELFWRGWLQQSLSARRGRWQGAVLAASAYAGVHLASGNPTLVAAAGVAGAYWSVLAAAGIDMESLILSHVLWDILIFLVAPTGAATTVSPCLEPPARRSGRRSVLMKRDRARAGDRAGVRRAARL
jgi:CAAX protease family protein